MSEMNGTTLLLAFFAVIALMVGWILLLMVCWNYVIVYIFGAPSINFWQTTALSIILASIKMNIVVNKNEN